MDLLFVKLRGIKAFRADSFAAMSSHDSITKPLLLKNGVSANTWRSSIMSSSSIQFLRLFEVSIVPSGFAFCGCFCYGCKFYSAHLAFSAELNPQKYRL